MATKNNKTKKHQYESLTHGLWTTHDEEEFVEHLGSWTRNSLPRGILLAKYLNFMTNVRINFGAINKEKIITFTQKIIDSEGATA